MVRPHGHNASRSTRTVGDGHISGTHFMHAAIAPKLCFRSVRAAIALNSPIWRTREARISGDVRSAADPIGGKSAAVGRVGVLARNIRSRSAGAGVWVIVPATIPGGLIVRVISRVVVRVRIVVPAATPVWQRVRCIVRRRARATCRVVAAGSRIRIHAIC